MKIKQEQMKITEMRDKFKIIIDTILEQKKNLFNELSKMDHCLGRLRSYLTTEQTAKFLLIMEKVRIELLRLLILQKLT